MCADELSPKITRAGKTRADELSPIAQVGETRADELSPIVHPGKHNHSSCTKLFVALFRRHMCVDISEAKTKSPREKRGHGDNRSYERAVDWTAR